MIDKVVWAGFAFLALASCEPPKKTGADYPATLYRNSFIDPSLRIHWATFDADETDRTYNLSNCAMAARLLNSNSRAAATAQDNQPDETVGFWCEPGPYAEKGSIPPTFEAEYPTDTQ